MENIGNEIFTGKVEVISEVKNAMKYNFNHNLETEIKQAKEVAGDLDWYKENGYEAILPVGISRESSDEEIKKAVEKEFSENEKNFEEIQREVQKLLSKHSLKLDSFFSAFEYETPKSIQLFFTAYGSGGGYDLPDKVFVLMSDSIQDIFETIIHETVHLIIEKPLITKYNIPHWQKEMLVDILCESSLLDGIYRKNQIQNDSEHISLDYIEKMKFNRKDTLNYKPFLK
ncbi:MAG: hypothetical protein U5L10_04160 [Candidatus Moranbacteria bacterium]|nr:hypothetical protein [Candidatus Moranbacteria bacterium]